MDLGTAKRGSKKDSAVLDDLLGDLLSVDSPSKKKNAQSTPTRQRAGSGKGGKPGGKDDTFYSSLAAMAESDPASDVSEADVDMMAHSLGGLDDMDADLFGDKLNKKNGTSRSGKPTTPRRGTPKGRNSKSPPRVQSPSRSATPTSPPGSARGSLKRKPVKPSSPSTTAASNPSPPLAQLEQKPGTAPGKMTDLSSASENLKPGQRVEQRPDTAPKLRKKYDFGDFDPDDPLAGILSDNDADECFEGDRPKSATKKQESPINQMKHEEASKPPDKNALESPRRRSNLMDRPPTRSGSNTVLGGDRAAGVGAGDGNVGEPRTGVKAQTNIFSDSDDLLDGLGLEGNAGTASKKADATSRSRSGGDGEDLRPARSVFDSLLGKGTGAASLLEPKEKKSFVLDSKYSNSNAGSGDIKDTDEDDFQFGSYQPSAATGSRPSSRRSVRFQDDDDIFGLESHPSPRAKSPGTKGRTPPDMEWLETAESKPPAQATTTAVTTPAPSATAPTQTGSQAVVAKPPTPTGNRSDVANKPSDSPKKSSGPGAQPSATVANTAPSPRAWLGLDESDSDEEEFFKPKRSSARSATLPQSPALSTNPSPRVPPKKSPKKENDDDDDWLVRAKSRRQQMLSKDEGKDKEDLPQASLGETEIPSGRGGDDMDVNNMRVDLSSLIMDSPKFGGVSSAREDMFLTPQGRLASGHWESPRTPLSATVSGRQLQGLSPGTPVSQNQAGHLDPRLKYSTAAAGEDEILKNMSIQGKTSAPHVVVSQPQQQQQPFMQHLQEQKKAELIQQQEQLQQMLANIKTQYDSVNQVQSQGVPTPTYSALAASIELPDSLHEAHAKLRKVELEKHYTESMLESTRHRYEDELVAVETSYKNRLTIVEESNRKKEARLREENEALMQQHVARVRQLEEEKSSVSTAHYKALEDLEREKAQELEKLREHHRLAISALKRDHQEALERLASAKNQEINMVANANDTSKSLSAVVEQIQSNARDLGELQLKVDSWNRQGLDEREISVRSKDEQLRMLQERLSRQEEDNDRERKRLEDLIARMETQLREQTRLMEEERWKLKQDQSRAEAQQRALEEERRLWLDQQARERVTMERAREGYLEEQRNNMAQISSERRTLVEERTRFQSEQKTAREGLQQDAMKRSQAEADYEVLTRTITEEKSRHAARMAELQREEEKLASERSKLERERTLLEQERDKLADQAHQIRQQSAQIDHMTDTASRTRNEGEQAMEEALHIKSQFERRDGEIRKQLNAVKLMEDHISQEKLRLAKEKKEVENLKNSSLCVNCRSPLQGGVGILNLPAQNGFHTPHHMTPVGMSPAQSVHVQSQHQPGTNPLDNIAASIASDRAVRMWKIQAIKDKEYLDEERIYLESLRHTPYHSTASKS